MSRRLELGDGEATLFVLCEAIELVDEVDAFNVDVSEEKRLVAPVMDDCELLGDILVEDEEGDVEACISLCITCSHFFFKVASSASCFANSERNKENTQHRRGALVNILLATFGA